MEKLFTLLFLGFWTYLGAQNLVPNPSFEIITGCPAGAGWANINDWNLVPSHGGSPDYHHVCGNTTFGAPVNVFGSQLARTGSGYIGFVTYFVSADFREYLQVPLTTPLVSGQSYDVSAFLSLSDGSGYGTDGFGFYFSTGPISGTGGNTPLPFVPQVSNPTNNFITDKINWVPVGGTFTATANYTHMTIGNFKNDATTNFQVQSGWTWNYSYADDFSVVPTVIFSADLTEFEGELDGEIAVLHWNTRTENGTKSFELQRSIGDANDFQSIGIFPAKGGPNQAATYDFRDAGFDPTQLNYYRLREMDQNGGGGYSQAVLLKADDYIPQTKIKLFPNPVAAGNPVQLMIDGQIEQDLNWNIVDMQGRIVANGTFLSDAGIHTESLSIGDLATGTYILQIQSKNFHDRQLFLVN